MEPLLWGPKREQGLLRLLTLVLTTTPSSLDLILTRLPLSV